MKTALKRKWIKALLSGKYKQADSALKEGNAFCCLGVLADIKGCKWKGARPIVDGRDISREQRGYHLDDKFSGLSFIAQCRYARMNDTGSSFKEIAAAIKKTIRPR